jgi:hypothetical protein
MRYSDAMKRIASLLLILAGGCATAPPPAAVVATDSDQFRIETTVLAMYNVMSGPAGRHDWNRFKELFAPEARLIETQRENGGTKTTPRTPDEFATEAQKVLAEQAMFEHPVSTRIEVAGNIAHVLSRFEARHSSTDEKPYVTGVNSIQLVRSGDRWLILTVLTEDVAAE